MARVKQHMFKHVVNTHAYSLTHHGSCKLKLKLFMNAKKKNEVGFGHKTEIMY